ncbi:MAG: DUF6465 family protein [Lachnospiraceae bacterium]|nr:DUF6465 family protein [Lachnospiraceae bacterium]
MAEVKKNVVAPAATEVKKEEVKKEAPKAEVKKEAPKKEAPKKAEVKKAAAKKAPAKKEAPKKEAPKKEAAKKAPAKKVEVKETFAVQFAGKDYASDVIVKLVKDAYKATKNKAAIKTLNVYVNTDDSRAYYVINDEFHGSVEL